MLRAIGLAVALALMVEPVSAQELIAPADLRADFRLAVASIQQRHPDLSHSVSAVDLERAAKRIERQLDHPMTQAQAWATMARLNPVLADGHLFIGLADWRGEVRRAQAGGAALFPFEVSIDERGALRIVSELGGDPTPLAGLRILSIDGRDARGVMRDLSRRAHGDTPAFRRALLGRRWWLFYATVYGTPAVFDFVLETGPHSVPASRVLPELLQTEASFERTYRCEMDGRNAVLTANAFDWPDKARFYTFARDCFARMAAADVDHLVIDISRNGGGDDDMWREGLLRYIADRPYKHGSRYLNRILGPDGTPGEVVPGVIETVVSPPPDEPLRFRGTVEVRIGSATYSSAILFANVVQDYGFATVTGVGGAARTRQSGGVQSMRLPKTGLILFYPRFVLARPSGAATPVHLMPDAPGSDRCLRPLASGQEAFSLGGQLSDPRSSKSQGPLTTVLGSSGRLHCGRPLGG